MPSLWCRTSARKPGRREGTAGLKRWRTQAVRTGAGGPSGGTSGVPAWCGGARPHGASASASAGCGVRGAVSLVPHLGAARRDHGAEALAAGLRRNEDKPAVRCFREVMRAVLRSRVHVCLDRSAACLSLSLFRSFRSRSFALLRALSVYLSSLSLSLSLCLPAVCPSARLDLAASLPLSLDLSEAPALSVRDLPVPGWRSPSAGPCPAPARATGRPRRCPSSSTA